MSGIHATEINDPSDVNLQNLHVPSYKGTRAQRLAYTVASLRVTETWGETDTGQTFQWNNVGGTATLAWMPFGNAYGQGFGGDISGNAVLPVTQYYASMGDDYSGNFGATTAAYAYPSQV